MIKIWGCIGDQSNFIRDSDCLDKSKTFVINGKTICQCIFLYTEYKTNKSASSLLIYNAVQWSVRGY